jgi:hypothetical protein
MVSLIQDKVVFSASLAVNTTPVDRIGARWLSRWRAPAPGSLPDPFRPPRFRAGSAPTSQLSGSAQALLALRAAGLLAHLSWTLSRGFDLPGYPDLPPASYRI